MKDISVARQISIYQTFRRASAKGFLAPSLFTYTFSTLYLTLPQYPTKEKLTKQFEQTLTYMFNTECSLYLACNEKRAFTSEHQKNKM